MKIKIMAQCLGLLILMSLVACTKPDFENAGIELADDAPEIVVNLSNIMILPVEQRFQEYSNAGFYRFLAYDTEDGIQLPGYQGEIAKKLIEDFGVELAPGMSHQASDETHKLLQVYFLDYATRYNQLLLTQIKSDRP